jgi:hypothetical protein
MDEVHTWTYRQLLHLDQFINANEDAVNYYALGHYLVGKKIIDLKLDLVKNLAYKCTGFQRFLLFHSFGSWRGFGEFLLERLSIDNR